MQEDLFHIGVKAIIRNPQGAMLVLEINKQLVNGTVHTYWDLPGGRIQRGETPQQALCREIEEETGITGVTNIQPFSMSLSAIRLPLQDGGDVGLVFWVFTVDAPNTQVSMSDEHTALQWVSPAEAADMLRPKFPEEVIARLSALSSRG